MGLGISAGTVKLLELVNGSHVHSGQLWSSTKL